MSPTPTITIFVRHSADCKHKGDEFYRRCNCRKHFRWFANGNQHRRTANTRSWSEAEENKHELADKLSGRVVDTPTNILRSIRSAVDVFISAKEVEGLSADLIRKYKLWLGRLASYCEAQSIETVPNITGEIIIGFCGDWPTLYPSPITRKKLRERYKSFMRFCHSLGWMTRLPEWPKIQADDKAPTMPLSDAEYDALLDSVYVIVRAPADATVTNQTAGYWAARVRGLFLLMRWSGLSIMDALTFERSELIHRDSKHRVVTQRTKTGTDVSVVLPPAVATELFAVPNDNPQYFFWSGKGSPKSICSNWGKRFIVPCFKEAGIESEGYMKSHRLRDTFACDLLQKGVRLEDVSKLLGHKSIKTTEKHYGAWVPGRQDRLDAVVMETWPKTKSKKRARRKGLSK